MLGEKLRDARTSLGLSLSEVAERAQISAATLSRIERDKQTLGLDLFLQLAKILKVSPAACLGDGESNGNGADSLVQRFTAMDPRDRAAFWREVADEMSKRRKSGGANERATTLIVDELIAQIDYLRNEIESVRKNLRRH